MKKLVLLYVSTFALFFSSCGGGLPGTYQMEGSKSYLRLKSGGKLEGMILGNFFEGTYKKEDDRVVVSRGAYQEVLSINKEGCLEGRMGKFCK